MGQEPEMTSTVRLKQSEKDLLRKKSIELNKILIMNNQRPVTESELVHAALELSLKGIKADKDGNIFLDL